MSDNVLEREVEILKQHNQMLNTRYNDLVDVRNSIEVVMSDVRDEIHKNTLRIFELSEQRNREIE